MLKFNSKIHGIIDYGVVAFLWFAPTLFNLPPITSDFTYALGFIHLVLTITTEFELGLIKRIPMRIHGLIEFSVSIALVPIAFILNSLEGELSKNFYLFFALAVFLTWLLTDYYFYKEDSKV